MGNAQSSMDGTNIPSKPIREVLRSHLDDGFQFCNLRFALKLDMSDLRTTPNVSK